MPLHLTPNGNDEAKHAHTQAIPNTVSGNFKDLYEKLNNLDYIKGRFIVFPNVSDGGYKTLLRSGFYDYYKLMPCVGGYIDGFASSLGNGNQSIINGKNQEYGFKSIAVVQTSDNRKRTHEDLGKSCTWIKWSEPTAEALRQACLAKESRMSHDEPALPSLWITSVSVSNSKFLGRVEIDLNQQYNAIIGGRGTGKSTILEYLRWGLCDQSIDNIDSDIAPVQIKRKKLIDDTLQKYDGEVHVNFLLNDIKHVVKRSSKTQEILLKISDADFIKTTEQEIRNLFPLQAYSQKQLSSVGVRIEELKRFVELPIKKTLDKIRSDIRDTDAKTRVTYSNLIRKKEIEVEINKYNIEINSLTIQLEGLRANLKGLSDDDQKIIVQKARYDTEDQIIENLKNELKNAQALVESLKSEFSGSLTDKEEKVELENAKIIEEIKNEFLNKFTEIKNQIDILFELVSESSFKDISEKIKSWENLKADFGEQYEAAKANANVNQQQLKQIQDIEKRVIALKKLQIENRNALNALGDPEAIYKDLRERWDMLHNEKITTIDEQCQQFSSLSDGVIKAEITKSLDVNVLKQKFKIAFAGMNIKEQKIDDLCQYMLSAENPLFNWNNILTELESLVFHNVSGYEQLPLTPILDKCGLILSEKTRIVNNFEPKKWLDLSVTELEFNPNFFYYTNKDTSEYIEFVDASAGQQATALLSILLNQHGGPLIIDQPEDDVDSKMIKSIVEQIWESKSKRQLIFASHNANFVVNGDAELVICCDYIKAGDQTGGQIKCVGAIDNEKIKEEITTVTEGGEEAFKLRMKKYGF
ncbi:MAG: AAA family ATPase [Candidatus Schekmanbacteria bacterium]|nr:AAA family ATPase [Candidatus Schekmanbacteria bacterium]